jgi:hypothetical protein
MEDRSLPCPEVPDDQEVSRDTKQQEGKLSIVHCKTQRTHTGRVGSVEGVEGMEGVEGVEGVEDGVGCGGW